MRADEREEQFRAAYVALYPVITRYALGLTQDREVAHEVAQETFARLFDRWDKVEDPGAYAYRIATNLVRGLWRRRRDDRLRVQALGRLAAVAPDAPDPQAQVDVRQLVDALPRRYRDLVLLHYWADVSLPDIAAALDRPLGTVKRQLSEARSLLAGCLEGTR